MPLYEFKCEDCNALFERLIPVDTSSYNCPICEQSCGRIVSQIAPPIIKNSTPYKDNLTLSAKEIDKRVGETIENKIKPIFEDREKQKAKYREDIKEGRLKRMPSADPNSMEYTPADDQVVADRRKMLKEYDTALTEHRKKREAEGLSQFEDTKK